MNCKEANLIIAGLTASDIPENLAAHVRDCRACADLLALDVQVRATLQSQHAVASPYVLGRIRHEMSCSAVSSQHQKLWKNIPMKITIPTLAALALTATLLCIPRPAAATTATATFNKMKKAVLARAKDLNRLELHVGKTPNGSIGGWVVINGALTQLPANGNFHQDLNGGKIQIKTLSSAGADVDLSSLPPGQRKLVEKAIKDAMSNAHSGTGAPSGTYIINGRQVDYATVQSLLQQQGIKFSLDVDLNESDYKTISFGSDQEHLVLRSKNSPNSRSIVALDAKTNLPKSVEVDRLADGKWVAVKQSPITLL